MSKEVLINKCKIPTSMNHRILRHYTKLRRIGFDDLEFDGSHPTTNKEGITFADGTVC